MPDIGHIGPICSDSNDRSGLRPDASSSRMGIDGEVANLESPSREETVEDRARRIQGIRRAIEAGTYPSEEKLEVAMRRMLDELSS